MKEGEVHLEPRVDPVWFTREIEKAEQELKEARGKRQKAQAKALVWELKRRHATFLRRGRKNRGTASCTRDPRCHLTCPVSCFCFHS